MSVDVGYYVYLPTGYQAPENADKKYPVVYHLHGGRPGGEGKSVSLASFIHKAMEAGDIQPTIYVWAEWWSDELVQLPAKRNRYG